MPIALRCQGSQRQAKNKAVQDRDGEGLFLLIMPSGSKYWRLKYFFAGKEKVLALGVYPEISLADARERRAKLARCSPPAMIPAEEKKEAKRVAHSKSAELHLRSSPASGLKSASTNGLRHTRQANARPSRTAYPSEAGLTGPLPTSPPPEVLAMLRVVEDKGTLETARRVMQICGQIFMYAIATGRAERNPVPDLRGALKTPVVKHHSFLKAE